jgi:hypothetical protein
VLSILKAMASDDEWYVVRHLQPQGTFIFAVMWVKQCHKTSPSHHHEFIGGMVRPFPVMGGKNGIVLPIFTHIRQLINLHF